MEAKINSMERIRGVKTFETAATADERVLMDIAWVEKWGTYTNTVVKLSPEMA